MSHTDVNAHTDPAEVVEHPQWCTASESDTEAIHYSERLAIDPDGPGMVVLSVQAMQTWPWRGRDVLPWAIEMVTVDEGEERHFFLPPSQVHELIEALQLLVGQVER